MSREGRDCCALASVRVPWVRERRARTVNFAATRGGSRTARATHPGVEPGGPQPLAEAWTPCPWAKLCESMPAGMRLPVAWPIDRAARTMPHIPLDARPSLLTSLARWTRAASGLSRWFLSVMLDCMLQKAPFLLCASREGG